MGSQKANRGRDDRETLNDCRARQHLLKTALMKLAASVTPGASQQNSLSKGYFHVPRRGGIAKSYSPYMPDLSKKEAQANVK